MGLQYKSYIQTSGGYEGGKSVTEVNTSNVRLHKLSSNENLYGCAPEVIEAINSSLTALHLYPDGNPYKVQVALSEYYNHQLDPEQFIVTNGGSELLDLIIRGFLDPESECIVSNPCFMPYIMFSQWTGAKIVDIPLVEPEYLLDTEAIIKAITSQTKILFLCSPNNPTGSYIPKTQLEEIMQRVPSHVLVVFDEVYWQFADAMDYTTALPLISIHPNLIAINSLSKSFGLASLRLGYGYCSHELAGYIRKLCKPFLVNHINLNAAVAALGAHEFVDQTVTAIKNERKRVASEFIKLGVEFTASQANFHLIKPNMNENEFVQQMLENGVMVRPCCGFGAPGTVRITVGTPDANDAMLEAIKKMY